MKYLKLSIAGYAGLGLLAVLAGCAAEPEAAKQGVAAHPVATTQSAAPAAQGAAPGNVEQDAIKTLKDGRTQDAKVIQDAQNAANIMHR